MEAKSFTRALCIAIDIEDYSKRLESAQERVQHDLTRIIESAATSARLPFDGWIIQRQGDGQLILAPTDGNEPRYVDDFVRHLATEMSRHNRSLLSEARLRIRVALHHGFARVADNGFAGDAPILSCRLRDAQITKQLLKKSSGDLVLIVSSQLYHDVVLPEHSTHNPDDFVEVTVAEEKITTTAWVWLPGSEAARAVRSVRAHKPTTRADVDRQGPTFNQAAETINVIDQIKARSVSFGTTVRPTTRVTADDDE